MSVILDGKTFSNNLTLELIERTQTLKKAGKNPELIIVTASNDPASKVYVKNKIKKAEEIGIAVEHIVVKELDTKTLEYISVRNVPCIIQLPCNFAENVNESMLSKYITAQNDVDAFVSPLNIANLVTGQKPDNYPCTPMGIIKLLKYNNIKLSDKSVCVIGRSKIVGMPVSLLLNREDATVTICHSKTLKWDKYEYIKEADIIISATGHLNTLTLEDIQEYGIDKEIMQRKIIVDVGTNRDKNGKLCGDIPQEVKELSAMYTPSVGGVGPCTVIMLMNNVIESYEKR